MRADLRRVAGLKVALGHPVEEGLDFLAIARGEGFRHLAVQLLAALGPLLPIPDAVLQIGAGLVVELPDHLLLPVAPSLVARSHAIGQCDHHEGVEHHGVAHDSREFLDCRWILDVAGAGDAAHLSVSRDQSDEHSLPFRRELQTPRHLLGRKGALLLVTARVGRLACVVQKHGKVEDRRIVEMTEDFPVTLQLRVGGKEQGVDLVGASQCVLVGRVSVEELVLNQAG